MVAGMDRVVGRLADGWRVGGLGNYRAGVASGWA